MAGRAASDNKCVQRRKLSRLRIPAILVAAFACSVVLAGPAAAADTSDPSRPTGLAKTAATGSSVTLSWRASRDNVGVTGYRILRNGAFAGTAIGRRYTLTGLNCGTTYIVTVSTRDAAGNRSLPAAIFVRTANCATANTCPTEASVSGLLLEHKLNYGCSWPNGWAARLAVQSIRGFLGARAATLETSRAKRWHKVAMDELNAAAKMPGAWNAQGVLQRNAAGANAMRKLHRVIRVLHYHNPELYEVSKSEKWALAATMWYIAASDYNAHYAAGARGSTMDRAHTMLERGDTDFYAENAYRAGGRYEDAFSLLNGL